jgi:hypothetical protein
MSRMLPSKLTEFVASLFGSNTHSMESPTENAENYPTHNTEEIQMLDTALLARIGDIEDPDEAYRRCEQCIEAGLLNITIIAPLCPYVIELVRLTRSGQADGPRMWHCLALVAESCKKHDAARKILERAILSDPLDISLRNSLAVVLLNQGKPSIACCVISQAALIQPHSEAIRTNLEACRQVFRSRLESFRSDMKGLTNTAARANSINDKESPQ